MKIQDYIESGILETFVMGSASEEEVQELLYMQAQYPEVNDALKQLENDMELIARSMAITPPPNTWNKIEQKISEIIVRDELHPESFIQQPGKDQFNGYNSNTKQQYIEVESESTHMKIHKGWKWVFAAVFILAKIFLGCAIYFYLENRQATQQVQELKTELKQLKK